jgi:uncharacterized membrane protein YvlD (DUF360 family)
LTKTKFSDSIDVVWNLLIQIVSAILGLYLSLRFVPGVYFQGPLFILPTKTADIGPFLTTFIFVGILLGILNRLVKPLLNKITFPLRIITFNLFTLVVAMFLVWLVDIFSPELVINGLKALFFTTLIVLIISFILSKWLPDLSRTRRKPAAPSNQ